jgi:hypothetical protein
MKTLKTLLLQSLKNNGKFSLTNIITLLVAIAATVFMWKLIIVGGMTVDYFVAYLCYGVGHKSIGKYLDTRKKD